MKNNSSRKLSEDDDTVEVRVTDLNISSNYNNKSQN